MHHHHRFLGGWGSHIISIIGFGVAVLVGKYPGFMKRKFGSTTWGETLVMCGISIEVDEVGMRYSPHDWKGMVSLTKGSVTATSRSRAVLFPLQQGCCS